MKPEQLYQLFRKSKGISTDSRTVASNQIFIALWGKNYNGNEYAAEAINRGASWAVIDDPAYESEKTILVDDCLAALQELAAIHRKKMNASVLAITGTNGKTTTKELITAVLSKKLKVHSTRGNLNNHIGVPLSLLSAPEDTEMMVIEMGASHVGEIHTLCQIADPDYGIITNIGKAHIEGFKTSEALLKTKTELYEHLRKNNGVAFYNDLDPVLTAQIFKVVNKAVPFSNPTGLELLLEPDLSEIYLSMTAKHHHQTQKITTNLFGEFNIENVKAAVATGLFFGLELKEIAAAIAEYHPGNNRSQIVRTGKNILICDSYNANPTSMSLAIKSFSALKKEKKLCILGDMLELGDQSTEEHNKTVKLLKRSNIDKVYLTGSEFFKTPADKKITVFPDVERLMIHLKAEPVTGYHILIKGSRGLALERIYELL